MLSMWKLTIFANRRLQSTKNRRAKVTVIYIEVVIKFNVRVYSENLDFVGSDI